MNKKAMGVGQVFVFIIAALTFSLIMIFGYKAISGFIASGEQVEFVQFKNNLEGSVQKIYTEYGSVRLEKLRVPGKYTQICFINLDYPPEAIKKEWAGLCEKDQVACTVWDDALNTEEVSGYGSVDENVFLKPSAVVKLKIGRISLVNENGDAQGYLCLPINNGFFSVMLEGKGDHTELSKVK